MPERVFRRLADRLLESLLEFSPAPLQEWGGAMRAELAYIEGDWAAMRWAAGSSLVLLRRMILDRFRPPTPSLAGGMLPASEGSMQKAVRWVAVACVALSLAFLTAPAFRQALDVTVSGWRFRNGLPGEVISSKTLDRIAAEARQRRDPAGLAFAAIHSSQADQGIRLADEAVAMTPRFTWVYAVVARRNLTDARAAEWIARVRKWDPANALPHLLEADRLRFIPGRTSPANDSAWLAAMDAAFHSMSYDSYKSRVAEVTSKAVYDYGLTNPLELLAVTMNYDPVSTGSMGGGLGEYVRRAMIEPGKKLESEGKLDEVVKLYWTVASFGMRMEVGTEAADDSQRAAAWFLQMAGLQPMAALARQVDRKYGWAELELSRLRQTPWDFARERMILDTYRWNAMAVGVSFAVFLAAALIVLACAGREAARRWAPRLRIASLDTAARVAGVIASVAMFASSIALYVSYQPFAKVFSQTINRPGTLQPLRVFLSFAYVPRLIDRSFGSPTGLSYAMVGVCVVALAVILARRLALTLRPSAAK